MRNLPVYVTMEIHVHSTLAKEYKCPIVGDN